MHTSLPRSSIVLQYHDTAWISPSAQLYGAVSLKEGASVWPLAVIRSEATEVRVGRLSNIQDFAMLHAGFTNPVIVGDFCSITHHATIHGATVGDACIVSINATIMDGAVIGSGSIVAAGAVVTEGSRFEPGSIIAGIPAKVIAQRDATRANRLNAWIYYRNAEAYRRGDHRAWSGMEYQEWLVQLRDEIVQDRDLERFPLGA
jgi:carbonic anhydrase/acetyltransferase-like protein (isoleucine patch superfamily)